MNRIDSNRALINIIRRIIIIIVHWKGNDCFKPMEDQIKAIKKRDQRETGPKMKVNRVFCGTEMSMCVCVCVLS